MRIHCNKFQKACSFLGDNFTCAHIFIRNLFAERADIIKKGPNISFIKAILVHTVKSMHEHFPGNPSVSWFKVYAFSI